MSRSLWHSLTLAVVYLLTGLVNSTIAAEKLVVPFACESDPTGVYAIPSDLQTYAVLGQRDAAPFTACDPRDDRRCRTLMLHRFEIDCDGQRVAWPEFYAAISSVTTGRALYEDDRLLVRVRPQRTSRATRRRYDRRGRAATFVIEMPEGYAPVRGTVARFVGGEKPSRSRRAAAVIPSPQPTERRSTPQLAKKPPSRSADTKTPAIPAQSNGVTVTKPARNPVARPAPSTPKSEKTKTSAKPGLAIRNVAEASPPGQPQNVQPAPSVRPKLLNAKPPAANKQPASVQVKKSNPKLADEKPADKDSVSSEPKPKLAFGRNLETFPNQELEPTDKAAPTSRPTPMSGDRSAKQARPALNQSAPSLYDTLAVLTAVMGLIVILVLGRTYFLHRQVHHKPARTTHDPSIARSHADALVAAAGTLEKPQVADAGKPSPPKPTKPSAQPNFNVLTVPPKPDAAHKNEADTVEPQLPGLTGRGKSSTISKPSSLQVPDRQPVAAPEPKLPIPDVQRNFDFAGPKDDGSVLILPTTRNEALAALGVGSNAGEDVIVRVVKSLKESCRVEEAQDSYDKMHRLQRMSQIEAAWKILAPSGQTDALSEKQQTDRHA